MTTIKDVSELAGVSQATVSRVLNGTTFVDENKKRRVEKAIQELGYRPNAHARSLATRKSNTVGMVVSELSGPFFGDMMAGAESVLRKHHKQIVIACSHANQKEEKEAIDFLLSCNCDALILHSESLSDKDIIELSNKAVFLVLLNRQINSLSEQCFALDNFKGSYLATEYLIKQGHQRIGCVAGPQWKFDANARLNGYQAALNDHAIKTDESLVVEGDFTRQSGFDAVAHLLDTNASFSALICGNDDMAFGAIDALNRFGRSVPKDVAVCGFDDSVFAQYTTPSLSTVRFPIRQIAEDAAKLVLQNVYDKPPTQPIKLSVEPKLVLRNSS